MFVANAENQLYFLTHAIGLIICGNQRAVRGYALLCYFIFDETIGRTKAVRPMDFDIHKKSNRKRREEK